MGGRACVLGAVRDRSTRLRPIAFSRLRLLRGAGLWPRSDCLLHRLPGRPGDPLGDQHRDRPPRRDPPAPPLALGDCSCARRRDLPADPACDHLRTHGPVGDPRSAPIDRGHRCVRDDDRRVALLRCDAPTTRPPVNYIEESLAPWLDTLRSVHRGAGWVRPRALDRNRSITSAARMTSGMGRSPLGHPG